MSLYIVAFIVYIFIIHAINLNQSAVLVGVMT